ncbi:hypothetical protein HTG_01260 [Natrinema mahii]|nr:hypothetical protein HTG_01260 [Natrinema mahii]
MNTNESIADRASNEKPHKRTVGHVAFGECGVNVAASVIRLLADSGQLCAENLDITSNTPALSTDRDTRYLVSFVDSDPNSIDDVNDQLPLEVDQVAANRTIVIDAEGAGKAPAVMLGMIDDPDDFVGLLRENLSTESGDLPDVLFLSAGITGGNGGAGLMMIPELRKRGLLFDRDETKEIYALAVGPLGPVGDIDTLGLPGGAADEDSWRADLQAAYLDADIDSSYDNTAFGLERAQKALQEGHYQGLFVLANSHTLGMQAVNHNPVPVRTLQDRIGEHRLNPVNDPFTDLYQELGYPHTSVPAACNEMIQTAMLPLLASRANLPGVRLLQDMTNVFDGAEVRAAFEGEIVSPGYFGVDDVADLNGYYVHSDIPEDVSEGDLDIVLSSVAKVASLLVGAPHREDALKKYHFFLHARDFDLNGVNWLSLPARLSGELPRHIGERDIRIHAVEGLERFPVGDQEFAVWAYPCLEDVASPYRARIEQEHGRLERRTLGRGGR